MEACPNRASKGGIMKARLLLTGLLLAASTGALTGCVVYPARYGGVVEPGVVVQPAPYYGPRYHYYDYRRDWRYRDRGGDGYYRRW
jgi:hypothetical protein